MEKNNNIFDLVNQNDNQLETHLPNNNSANVSKNSNEAQIDSEIENRSNFSRNIPDNAMGHSEEEEQEYEDEEEYNPVCDLCMDSPDEIIQLNCVHKFCLFCSIEVIFYKITFKNKNENQHMLDSIFTNINCTVCNTNTELGEDCIGAIKTCFQENFDSCLIDNDELLHEVENSHPNVLNKSIPEEIKEVDEDNFSDENVNLKLFQLIDRLMGKIMLRLNYNMTSGLN